MPHLPGHKYLGPGSELNDEEPVDRDDEISLQHDQEYEKAESAQDIRNADDKAIGNFVQDLLSNFNPHSALGALGLGGKRIAESIAGIQYPNYSQRSQRDYNGDVDFVGGNEIRSGIDERGKRYQQVFNPQHFVPSRRDTVAGRRYQPYLGVPRDQASIPDSPPEETQISPPNTQDLIHAGPSTDSRSQAQQRVNILSDIVLKKGSKRPAEPQQQPAKKIGIAQPNNSQSSEDSDRGALGNFFKNFNPNSSGSDTGGAMDTQDVPTPEVGTASSVSRAGSGPGMGSAGAAAKDAPTIFTSPKNSGTAFNHTFHQAYRFVVPACLTAWAVVNDKVLDINPPEPGMNIKARGIRIGSSMGFRMDRLCQYIDPTTYHQLISQCAEVHCGTGKLEVVSLGVRAPYSTNTSNIEVANANLQAQVMDISPLQDDYGIEISGEDDYIDKIMGHSRQLAASSTLNTEFNEVSARFETRVLRNRVLVTDNYIAKWNGTTATFGAWDVKPMDINLLHYVKKSVNGSNLLGTAFVHTCKFNSLLHKLSGTRRADAYALGTYESDWYGGNQPVDMMHNAIPTDADTGQGTGKYAGQTFDFQDGAAPYPVATAYGMYCMNEENKNMTDRYALYAIYNIRNFENDVVADTSTAAYNSIVNLNWEVVLNFSIDINGIFICPIYYGITSYTNTGWRNHRHLVRNVGQADATTNTTRIYQPAARTLRPGWSEVERRTLTATAGVSTPDD
uniref:Structural protein n=1 Tax=Emberiza spodocephala parvoviridae sp. TaxID=2794481 RepID=A0A8A4XDR4_9VIRU|nr:MAG: structural protein [Emberiza spodocephala parvoviridae sp.]